MSSTAMNSLCRATTDIGKAYQDNPVYYDAPLLLASNLDSALMGVLVMSLLTYHERFKMDRLFIKILVWSLFILNIGQSATVLANTISTFVIYFGNWDFSNLTYFLAIQTFETVSSCLAQMFFLERMYQLSKSWTLSALALLLSAGGVALGIAVIILTAVLPTVGVEFASLEVLTRLVVAWKACTFSCDLLLTVSIIYHLNRSRTGWQHSDAMFSAIIGFTAQAQLFPLLASLWFLVSYATDPSSNLYAFGSFGEAKFAALAVIHCLNSRAQIRSRLGTPFPAWTVNTRSTSLHKNGEPRSTVSAGSTAPDNHNKGPLQIAPAWPLKQGEEQQLEVRIGEKQSGLSTWRSNSEGSSGGEEVKG